MPSALESTCLSTSYFTMRLTAALCCGLRVRIHGEVRAPSVLLLVSRPEPAPARGLATERRAAR